jgi:hypothetical protein
MTEDERRVVLERLRELEGWSAYIFEAVTLNQRQEPATMAMLERTVGMRTLKQLREMSWSLRDKLHVVGTELELSRGEPLAALEIRA